MSPFKSVACALLLMVSIGKTTGQNNPTGEDYFQKANELKKNMQPDSALVYYEKASSLFHDAGNMEQFVNAYNQIGVILTRKDEYEKAKTYLDKALLTGLSFLDSNHLTIATTYISLGVIDAAEERYEESIRHHNKALSIRLLKLGEYDSDVATSYGNIGNVYLRSRELDKSIDAHLKAMKIREKLYGAQSSEATQSYTHLGHAYREKKEYATSLEYFEKALQNKIVQRGEGHKELVNYYKNISDVHYLMGNKQLGDHNKSKAEEIK